MNSSLKNAILKDYLEDYSLEAGLKKATIISKKGTLIRFLRWLKNKPLNAKSCRKWIRWLNKKELMPESIKHEVRVIRATIRFLYKRGFIKKDFASEIPSPKVGKKPLDIVTAKIAEKIIFSGTQSSLSDNWISKKAKSEHRQALKFVLRTGLRSRELIDLKDTDINLENETFTVNSKSGNIDVLPIPKDMLKELRKRKENDRVFNITRETLNKCLKRGSKKLKITTRVRTHTLRHIFCTSLLKNGVPIQVVSRLMRHASVSLTDSVYSHYQIDDLRLALNSRHPLIMNGLNTNEFFDTIQNTVLATGISKDKRFKTNIDRNNTDLMISIQINT